MEPATRWWSVGTKGPVSSPERRPVGTREKPTRTTGPGARREKIVVSSAQLAGSGSGRRAPAGRGRAARRLVAACVLVIVQTALCAMAGGAVAARPASAREAAAIRAALVASPATAAVPPARWFLTGTRISIRNPRFAATSIVARRPEADRAASLLPRAGRRWRLVVLGSDTSDWCRFGPRATVQELFPELRCRP